MEAEKAAFGRRIMSVAKGAGFAGARIGCYANAYGLNRAAVLVYRDDGHEKLSHAVVDDKATTLNALSDEELAERMAAALRAKYRN